MLMLDTNIFLEVLLDQRNAEQSAQLLSAIKDNKVAAVVSNFAVDSMVIALERYKKYPAALRIFLMSLLGYRGLRIYNVGHGDKIRATEYMEKYHLDFDDSLTLHCALTNTCEILVSFDTDFNKIKEIKRRTPSEVLATL